MIQVRLAVAGEPYLSDLVRFRAHHTANAPASGRFSGALVVSRNRTQTRRRPVRKIEEHFVDVTPAPPFRRIIGFDDRVLRCAKMFRSVPVGRLITAADMTTGATDAQMQPRIAQFQAFLTPESARNDVADSREMCAIVRRHA